MLKHLLLAVLLILLLSASRLTCRSQQRPAPSPPSKPSLSPEQHDPYKPYLPPRAYAYHRAGRVLFFVSLGWSLLGYLLLLRTGISARLRDLAERLLSTNQRTAIRQLSPDDTAPGRAPPFRVTAAYYCGYTLFWLLWGMPIGLCSLAIEHQYGFSNQSVWGYLQDSLTNTGVGLLMIPVIWGGYWLYARSPRRWWLWAWAALVPLIFFAIVLQPVVIAPLYNHYTPLAPGPLRSHILDLAAKSGISEARVYVEDTSRRTSHVNAFVVGLGPSTRIILNDTALQKLPQDQLLAMLGHEMGHYVERHIWYGFLSAALGSGFLLWLMALILPRAAQRWKAAWRLRSLRDIASLPLVMLVVFLLRLAQDPIANAESRYLEHRADAFGLRVTHLNDATARLFVGFAERDFSDPDPPVLMHFWFGTHPTLSERIVFAREYKDE